MPSLLQKIVSKIKDLILLHNITHYSCNEAFNVKFITLKKQSFWRLSNFTFFYQLKWIFITNSLKAFLKNILFPWKGLPPNLILFLHVKKKESKHVQKSQASIILPCRKKWTWNNSNTYIIPRKVKQKYNLRKIFSKTLLCENRYKKISISTLASFQNSQNLISFWIIQAMYLNYLHIDKYFAIL